MLRSFPEQQRLQAALTRRAGRSSDFDLDPEDHHGNRRDAKRGLRAAAVLVPVWQDQLILTKRASHLKHHPGQIAFPGGKLESGDTGPEAAALREAREEVGLAADGVQVLGRLPMHETVTGFLITPVLGLVHDGFVPQRQEAEVEEIFCVPLRHVLNPANFAVEGRRWRGEWRAFYTVPYGPYYIWGATARILRGLAESLVPEDAAARQGDAP